MLTQAGQTYLANTQSAEIAEIAFGGGGGVVPTPDGTETALVEEFERYDVEYVRQTGTGQYQARVLIPAPDGPWTLREIGVFASDGTLLDYGAIDGRSKQVGSPIVYAVNITVDPADDVTVNYDESTVYAVVEDLPTEISDLSDVDTSGATQDQVLTYDAGSGTWGAEDASSGGGTAATTTYDPSATLLRKEVDDGQGGTEQVPVDDVQEALDALADRAKGVVVSGNPADAFQISDTGDHAWTVDELLLPIVERNNYTSNTVDTLNAADAQTFLDDAIAEGLIPPGGGFAVVAVQVTGDYEWSIATMTGPAALAAGYLHYLLVGAVPDGTAVGAPTSDPVAAWVGPIGKSVPLSPSVPAIVELTQSEYDDAGFTPDDTTIYRTTDTSNVYLGTVQLN